MQCGRPKLNSTKLGPSQISVESNAANVFASTLRWIHQKLSQIGYVTLTIVLLVSVWCGFNIAVFLVKYLRYDTIITLHQSPPNTTDFPGITVCAPSIFTPQQLAGD